MKFWGSEVLSKGGSSYFCFVSYFLSFNGNLCFFKLVSTDTIQWSKMNLFNVVLMMSKLLLNCVKIRSEMFPLTCFGPEMCCSGPSALIVSLKMITFALVRSSIWILKSPNMILLWY